MMGVGEQLALYVPCVVAGTAAVGGGERIDGAFLCQNGARWSWGGGGETVVTEQGRALAISSSFCTISRLSACARLLPSFSHPGSFGFIKDGGESMLHRSDSTTK